MADVEKKVRVELEGGSEQFRKEFAAGAKAAADVQKQVEAVQKSLDKVTGAKAEKTMTDLAKAVDHLGGVASLDAQQVARLRKEIDLLAAAGAKVPKTLHLPQVPKTGGLGVGLKAGAESALQGLAPGGAIGTGLAAIGPAGLAAAAGVGAVALAAKTAFDELSHLAGEAERWSNVASSTGLGTREVQQLEAFLQDAGFQAEDLEKIMKGLAKSIEGGGDELAQFGIDVRELKGLAPEKQLQELARQVTAIADPTARAAAEMAAFGKAGAQVDAVLRQIATGGYKELNVLSDQAVADLVAIDAELDKAGRSWDTWKKHVEVALLHAGQALIETKGAGFGSAAIAKLLAPPPVAVEGDRSAAIANAQQEIAAEIDRRKKAAALKKRKEDEDEAKRRAKAEPAAFQGALSAAEQALAGVETKLSAVFNADTIAGKLQQIGVATAAEIAKVQDQIDKVKLSKDLFPQDKAKVVAVYEAQIAKLRELGAAQAAAAQEQLKLDEAQKVFGTNKNISADAVAQFKAFKDSLSDAKKGLNDLTVNELTRAEAELSRLEKATRGTGKANGEIATALGVVRSRLRDENDEFEKAAEVNHKYNDALRAFGPSAEDAQQALEKVAEQADILRARGELTGQRLDELRAKIAALQGQGATNLPESLKDVVDHTKAWIAGLNVASSILGQIGGKLGKIGSFIGDLGGLLSGKKAFGEASKKGGLEGVLGKIGAAGQIAEAAIGIGKAIVGLFKSDPIKKAQKEAGQALGHGISREMAEQFAKEAKDTGKTVAQVAREWAAKVKAEQDKANLDTLRGGVEIAKSGAEQLLGIMDKLSPKAQAAGAALVKAVADAMAANGLGVLATGELAKSEKFGAVQTAVSGAGQVFQGLRQAGGISTDLLANGGAFADALRQQAVDAAKEAGLSDAEAQKAGLAAIAPLLRDQLEASLQTGQKLSAQTQQLIDDAKANGITIVADPMIELLAVQKEALALQKGQSRGGTGTTKSGAPDNVLQFAGGSAGFQDFGTGTLAELHGIEAVVRPIDFAMPTASFLGAMDSPASGWNDALERGTGAGVGVNAPVSIVIQGANKSPKQIAAEVTNELRLRNSELVREIRRLGP